MLPLNTSSSPARAGAAGAGASNSPSWSSHRNKRAIGGVALVGTAVLLFLTLSSSSSRRDDNGVSGTAASSSSSSPHAPPAKQGAGLVLWREDLDAVLLLQRRSKHHDRAWGLPGGNVEKSDLSLLDAAEREAAEELGSLPSSFSVLTRIDATRAGKKGKEKAYSAFVLRVPSEAAEAFVPVLNKESRSWGWFSREEAHRGGGGGGGASGGGGSGGGSATTTTRKEGGKKAPFALHPVAADLLNPGTQSRALLDEAISSVSGAAAAGGGGAGGNGNGGGGGERRL